MICNLKKQIVFNFIFLLIMTLVKAEDIKLAPLPLNQPGSLGFIFETKIGNDIVKMPFAIFLPKTYESEKNRRFPVILFLHGAGEGGTDLAGVFIHGPCGVASRTPAMLQNLPFIVISPQSTQGWSPLMIKTVSSLLQSLPDKYRMDRDRILVTGLSMGGLGCWAALSDAPAIYAGASPICARSWNDPNGLAGALQSHSIWGIVGGADDGAFVNGAKIMYTALTSIGADANLTVIPNAGHGVWEQFYNNPLFYHWMVRQVRPSSEMLKQAEAFRKLQNEENSLTGMGIGEVLSPDRIDNSGLVTGWNAEWFKGVELKDLLVRRIEPKVEYPDGNFKLPGDVKENISVRMSGWVKIEKMGNYTFGTAADDGTRLSIGKLKLIEDWNGHGIVEQQGSVRLKQGWHKIAVEYFQGGGGAGLSIFWSGPGFQKKILGDQDIFCEPIPMQ